MRIKKIYIKSKFILNIEKEFIPFQKQTFYSTKKMMRMTYFESENFVSQIMGILSNNWWATQKNIHLLSGSQKTRKIKE